MAWSIGVWCVDGEAHLILRLAVLYLDILDFLGVHKYFCWFSDKICELCMKYIQKVAHIDQNIFFLG